jgi:simple sugar transport system permease protein
MPEKQLQKTMMDVVRMKELGAVAGLLLVMLAFSLLSDRFLTASNMVNVFTVTSELGIIAVGVCFLMIAGEFDLSVSSVFAIAPMVGALVASAGAPLFVGILVGLLVAAVIGFINGQLVLRTGVPSFIVTLGGMMFYRGVILAVSRGFPVDYLEPAPLMHFLGGRTTFGLRWSGVWFIVLVVLFQLILARTRYGNHVSAVGGNPGTAKAVGIDVWRVKLTNFVLCSMTAAMAGFMRFGRFRSVDPTSGQLMELEAIAACVIGGALLTGGYGSIVGAFLGAFLMGVMRSGLILAGAPPYWYQGFIGVVLVISVILNTRIRKAVAGG